MGNVNVFLQQEMGGVRCPVSEVTVVDISGETPDVVSLNRLLELVDADHHGTLTLNLLKTAGKQIFWLERRPRLCSQIFFSL